MLSNYAETFLTVNMSDKALIGRNFFKLMNNSSSLNQEKHDRNGVLISDLNKNRFLRFYFSIFSVVISGFHREREWLKNAFDHISKHLEVRQKKSYASYFQLSSRCVKMWSNAIFRVWYIMSRANLSLSALRLIRTFLNADYRSYKYRNTNM